jgi:TldD protein
MFNPAEYYLNIFNVTVPQLESLVGTALRYGGSYADLYFENTAYSNLLLKDSEVSSGGIHHDFGVGIRVLCSEKTGYAYSESTDYKDMEAAAKAAAAIAQGATRGKAGAPVAVPCGSFKDIELPHNYYPVALDWRLSKQSEFLPFLNQLEKEILSRDSRIVKVIARISNSMSDVMMFNSLGELTYETRPMGSVAVSVIAQENGKSVNKSVSRSFRMGAELIDEDLVYEIADEAVEGLDERFEAKRPKGGQMSVVMGAGASGILLHEAMGHAFEADFNRKGQSIFSDKMGKKICSDKINVVDDATIAWNRGAGNLDDEGIAGEKTYMVKDGVLTSYLHDRISADFYKVAPTGNGRRESFRFNPIPRMRATYMEGGDCDPAEIISSVQNGVYVDEFSNGQVKIGEGDFTFFVKNGFLIENGRLTMPIKDINIIGNGPQALADITMVGNDLIVDNGTWTCGKEQSVPVSCGMPTVLVKNLTVGGE